MKSLTVILLLVSDFSLALCDKSTEEFTFDHSNTSFTSYINTESIVRHIEIDRYNHGNLLFSDDHALVSTDGNVTETVAGEATSNGYREGIGKTARFFFIVGFYQISSRKVVVVDHSNHCLRIIDRQTGQTHTFAGSCTKSGNADGAQALFHYPSFIIPDKKNQDMLLITDHNNKAVRHIDVYTRIVSSIFFKNKAINRPFGITQDVPSGDIYLTTDTAIYKLNYQNQELTLIAGSPTQAGDRDGDFTVSLFDHPRDLLLIDEGKKFLVIDAYNHRLRVLNTESNTTYYLCAGSGQLRDGDMENCTLYYPQSMMVSGDSIYIGEQRRISKLSDAQLHTLTCPMKHVALTSPENDLATFQLKFGYEDHILLLPAGRHPYIIKSADQTCNSTLTAEDYRIRHTLEFVAHYKVDCSIANSTVTWSMLKDVAKQRYSIIEALCGSVCKRPGYNAQPILSCDGADDFKIRWPTDLVLTADIFSVPADIRHTLENKIINRGVTLDAVVLGATPPIVYPIKADNGGYVSLALSTKCINGLTYSALEEKCV